MLKCSIQLRNITITVVYVPAYNNYIPCSNNYKLYRNKELNDSK